MPKPQKLLALLRECAAGFELPRSEAGCRRTLDLCSRFKDGVTKGCADLRLWKAADVRQAARREILAAAERVAALNAALKPGSHAPLSVDAAHCLVSGGAVCVGACAALAAKLGLSSQDAFRVSAAAAVVWEAGRVALAALAAERRRSDAARQMCARQVCAAAAVMRHLLEPDDQPEASAAFAGSTGRPAVLVPWLGTVAAALETLDMPERELLSIAPAFCAVCDMLLVSPAYAAHAAAVGADPRLAARLAAVLLRRLLPAVAADPRAAALSDWSLDEMALSDLAGCLSSAALDTAVRRHLLGSSDAPAVVGQAAACS